MPWPEAAAAAALAVRCVLLLFPHPPPPLFSPAPAPPPERRIVGLLILVGRGARVGEMGRVCGLDAVLVPPQKAEQEQTVFVDIEQEAGFFEKGWLPQRGTLDAAPRVWPLNRSSECLNQCPLGWCVVGCE